MDLHKEGVNGMVPDLALSSFRMTITFAKMGLRPCLKLQNRSYGWCRVSPSGVSDGIGQKTPPANIPCSFGEARFVNSSNSLIPTLAIVCFHSLPQKKKLKCIMTMAAAEMVPRR
jgi:hypothetical protein